MFTAGRAHSALMSHWQEEAESNKLIPISTGADLLFFKWIFFFPQFFSKCGQAARAKVSEVKSLEFFLPAILKLTLSVPSVRATTG